MKFYGYAKCSSCRDAEKLLRSRGLAYEFVDITENPPSVSELTTLVKNSGLDLKKFLNTSGEVYRSMDLKSKLGEYSDEQLIALLASQGRLLKRPLITDGRHTTVGAKPEALKHWVG